MAEISDEAINATQQAKVTSHRVRSDGLTIWTVDYRPVRPLTIDVEADDEDEARTVAAGALAAALVEGGEE